MFNCKVVRPRNVLRSMVKAMSHGGSGSGIFAAAEEHGVLFVIALAQHEAQMVVLHVLRRTAQADPAGDENRLRVAVAEGLQQIIAGEEFQ